MEKAVAVNSIIPFQICHHNSFSTQSSLWTCIFFPSRSCRKNSLVHSTASFKSVRISAIRVAPWANTANYRPFSFQQSAGNTWFYARKSRARFAVCKSAGSSDYAWPASASDIISPSSIFRAICFYAITTWVSIPLFVVMLVCHPFVLLLDRSRRLFHHLVNKLWASISLLPFCKVDVQGWENLPPPDMPAVYVANHQSYLDIYALLLLGRSFKFISKSSIFFIPIVGWSMFLTGHIPLHRMDNKSQMECLKRCLNALQQGASVLFFPEGTRTKDGNMSTFKKGAFSVAAKAQVPVVPITIMGTGAIMPSGMERFLRMGSIKIIVDPPINSTDANELCMKARTSISSQLLRHGFGVTKDK